MFEVKNNSDAPIFFRRPDLKLNFDLLAGESYVITARQAMALELYTNDMDISITPSVATEPDEETQSVEVDKEAAVRGVAMVGVINFKSQSIRPENEGDFFNTPKTVDNMSDEEKQAEVSKQARAAKKADIKLKKATEALSSDEEKKKAEKNIKEEEENAVKSDKAEPTTGGVDLGELVPMAGHKPENVTKDPKDKK